MSKHREIPPIFKADSVMLALSAQKPDKLSALPRHNN
jgi:hypothetical protein